ncbi:hypothetical protein HG535_0A03780 [Zygotorulaspora mrakii]|uniref:Nucleolar complex protein 2 n=1 Tax=Zygotorulaspora mrakii TaxID=42260 RepID=A0A7H9AXC5_ZYGMR|nr:uncharacterized protein HG535_0A03780 [Zygotorulaspora mrakii]QLG70439.1 hypothetical protein HG535_0A03780 [Zygotorulaspora mrakii]
MSLQSDDFPRGRTENNPDSRCSPFVVDSCIMGKVSKATRKFQSKHLKRTLDNRKQEKNQKQRVQGRRGNKTEQEKANAALTKSEQMLKKSAKEEVFKDMSAEKFFDAGFEVPKESKKNSQARSKAQAEKSKENDGESSSEEEDMTENMADISKKDPEFYKYLLENDKELLDFNGSNPLDGIENEDYAEDEGEEVMKNREEHGEEQGSKGSAKIDLTLKLVKKWKSQANEKPNLKLIRNIVSAFKVAVNLNRDDKIEDYKYSITDAKAFQELLFLALKDLPKIIQQLVPYKNNKGSRTLPTGSNASKMASIVKSHASALITLINDITNTETAALVLHSVDQLLPYFLSYRRILKEIIKSIVDVWASTRDIETQIAAFAFLHNAAKEFKKSSLELILKSTYSTFIKKCRSTNMRTMPLINFQKNSAAELFSIDETAGYQIGFEYIRQLAIHLRNTMNATTKKTNKSNSANAYKVVYNWQFCHSLDFWSRVLSFSCNPEKENGHESQLRQLIYPLVQVTIGVIRLIPTPQFFPLRFYLIRSLIRLSQNTAVFIPIFPLLSEILVSKAFTKIPNKKESLAAFDFDHNIKCNKAYLGTRVYHEGLSEQFVDLLGEYFVLYCKNVAFPELVAPVIISLRRYMKTSKSIKQSKQLSNVVEKLKQNSSYIQSKRDDVDFSPTNKTEVARFLHDVPWEKTPLGSYIVIQREVKEESARILRESLEEEDKEKESDENKALDVDEDDTSDENSNEESANEDVEMSD